MFKLIETSTCTLCAKIESPGFYTGCLCKEHGIQNGWACDGDGNLTREHNKLPYPDEYKEVKEELLEFLNGFIEDK